MKTYKLIKEYPGSPKLGTIWNECSTDCPNYPEFWEEVVEKDYEILQLALAGSYNHRISNVSEDSDTYINSLLACKGNYIHSVKRLSDGEVFTVGDNAKWRDYKEPFKIAAIRLPSTGNVCIDLERNNQIAALAYLQEIKKLKPLFTTEDGVDIYEGDDFYSTRKDCSGSIIKYKGNSLEVASTKCKDFVDFSTKEKAEEYVDLNQPKYSAQDLINVYNDTNRKTLSLNTLIRELNKQLTLTDKLTSRL